MGLSDPVPVNLLVPSVRASVNDQQVRLRVIGKLEEIIRETHHVQTAVRKIEHVLKTNANAFGTGLAMSNKELRDWVISLVESVAYIEGMIGHKKHDVSRFMALVLVAAQKGAQRSKEILNWDRVKS